MKNSTEKRLFRYAMQYKKGISLGSVCLMVATALELAGPFIAKVIIDDHVLSIEGTWEQVDVSGASTSAYNDRCYVKENRDEVTDEEVISIFAIGKTYYLADGAIALKGERSESDGIVRIDGQEINAKELTLSELYHFFKPEQKPIILLVLLY